MQDRLNEYRSIRNYYFEDYYPLTGDGDLTGHDVWLAYQMHKLLDGSGIVVAFRSGGFRRRSLHRSPGRTLSRQALQIDGQ